MKVFGKGKRGVLIVGEAPGEQEDLHGRPFFPGAPAGARLHKTLRKLKIDLERDCWTINSLWCRPPRNKITKDEMIEWCRPNVTNTIKELKPSTIIVLGARAVESVIGWLFDKDVGGITKWAGWKIPCRKPNTWVCPTFHPSHVNRNEDENKPIEGILFDKHLKAAFELNGRPHKEPVDDLDARCVVEIAPTEGAALLRKMHANKRSLSFDYETCSLVPHVHSRIFSISVSDGLSSVACPFVGPVIEAAKEIVLGPRPKIGWNTKHEDLWTRFQWGKFVNNWRHDGMLVAHALDHRRGVSGLKFQAFVKLGQPQYNDTVAPYLVPKDESGPGLNRITECDLSTVLRYNALDSLLTWHVAKEQLKEIG
jgi:DNA polymerase